MHGFNHVVGSIFGHWQARKCIVKCQNVVNSIKHNPQLWNSVCKDAKDKGLKRLCSCSTTRFSSNYECMSRVLQQKEILQELVHSAEKAKLMSEVSRAMLRLIIDEADFWYELEVFVSVLEPFNKVCMSLLVHVIALDMELCFFMGCKLCNLGGILVSILKLPFIHKLS